jgi:hypothetical protein
MEKLILWNFWKERNYQESRPLLIGDWDWKSKTLWLEQPKGEYESQRDLGA